MVELREGGMSFPRIIKKSTLSRSERQDCIFFRIVWEERAKELGLTQKIVADRWNVTPAVINHFLHKKQRIDEKWKLRLAKDFRCVPQEIWPDWPYKEMTTVFLGDVEYQLVLYYRSFTPAKRASFEQWLHRQATEKPFSSVQERRRA